jgi:hypothetical protein
VDELPNVIDVGLAIIVMVGAEFEVTVTVAVDDDVPPIPVAEAV